MRHVVARTLLCINCTDHLYNYELVKNKQWSSQNVTLKQFHLLILLVASLLTSPSGGLADSEACCKENRIQATSHQLHFPSHSTIEVESQLTRIMLSHRYGCSKLW